jgi:hypothetical protein
MRIAAFMLFSLLSTLASANGLPASGASAAESAPNQAAAADVSQTGTAMASDALQCDRSVVIENAETAKAIGERAASDADSFANRLAELPAAARASVTALASAHALDQSLLSRAFFAKVCERLAEKGISPAELKPALQNLAQALDLTYPEQALTGGQAAPPATAPGEGAGLQIPSLTTDTPQVPAEAKTPAERAAEPSAPLATPPLAAAPPTAPTSPAPAIEAERVAPAPAPVGAAPASLPAPAAEIAPPQTAQAPVASPPEAAAPASVPPALDSAAPSAAPQAAAPEPVTQERGMAPSTPEAPVDAPASPPAQVAQAPAPSAPEAAPSTTPEPSAPEAPAAAPPPPVQIAEAPAQAAPEAAPSTAPEPAAPEAPAAPAPPLASRVAEAPSPPPAAAPTPAPVASAPKKARANRPVGAVDNLGEAECRALGVLDSCPDLNAVLDRLLERPLEYNHPDTMLLGRKTEITLVLRTDWEGKDLPTEVSEELKGLPGEVKQGLSKITRIMSAELTGREFEISPASRQERTVVPPQPVSWNWQVSPTDTGEKKPLKLRLYAHLQDGSGTMPPILVKTLDASINVDVTTWDWVVNQARTLEPIYAIGAALLGLLTAILTYFLTRRSEPVLQGGYREPSGTRDNGPVIGDLGQSATDRRSTAAPAKPDAPAASAGEPLPAPAKPEGGTDGGRSD